MAKAIDKKNDLERKLFMSQLNSKITAAFKMGQDSGIWQAFNIIMWTLHTKNGFGKKRLTKLHDEIIELAECIISGDTTGLTIDDIVAGLQEECKIKISEVKHK